MPEGREHDGAQPRERWEIALGLFGVLGAGLALAVPEARLFGVVICLLSAVLTGWLFGCQFIKIPQWLFRRRVHLPLSLARLPHDTVIALIVFLIGLLVPVYVLLRSPSGLEKPSVLLLWENDQLRLYNKGSKDLYLWGDKLDDTTADVESSPRIIPRDTYYYFLSDDLKKWMQTEHKSTGHILVPFEVYLEDTDKYKYIAKFELLIVQGDKGFTVHTQQMGVSEGGW